jgi:serine/threonine protein kinase
MDDMIISQENNSMQYKIYRYKQIGSGSFSVVHLGEDLSGNKVAIKLITLDNQKFISSPGKKEQFISKLELENSIMKQLSHPNIVSYFDVIKLETTWYIIMEYCNMGTLEDVIHYLDCFRNEDIIKEMHAYYYLNQLKDALHYLHSLNYLHRDIKPGNIFLTKSRKETTFGMYHYSEKIILKLGDFGLAKTYKEEENIMINTFCGSPLYMPPEMLSESPYNTTVDLWSFGIILYQMVFGCLPINARDFFTLKKMINEQEIDFHPQNSLTNDCTDILMKLLTKNNKMRISWKNFFNHSWFIKWGEIFNSPDKLHELEEKNASSGFHDDLQFSLDMDTSGNVSKQTNSFFREKITDSCFITPLGPSNLSKIKLPNKFNPIRSSDSKKYDYKEFDQLIKNSKIENKS